MSRKLRIAFNTLITFVLGILGLSCVNSCKYGVPHATTQVTGQITDSDYNAVEAARVTVKSADPRWGDRPILPRTYANEWGQYDTGISEIGCDVDSIDILVEDPAGAYQGDSVRVGVTFKRKSADDGWDVGEAHVRQNFKLKRNIP